MYLQFRSQIYFSAWNVVIFENVQIGQRTHASTSGICIKSMLHKGQPWKLKITVFKVHTPDAISFCELFSSRDRLHKLPELERKLKLQQVPVVCQLNPRTSLCILVYLGYLNWGTPCTFYKQWGTLSPILRHCPGGGRREGRWKGDWKPRSGMEGRIETVLWTQTYPAIAQPSTDKV